MDTKIRSALQQTPSPFPMFVMSKSIVQLSHVGMS